MVVSVGFRQLWASSCHGQAAKPLQSASPLCLHLAPGVLYKVSLSLGPPEHHSLHRSIEK